MAKVKDLIEVLKELNPEGEVVFYVKDSYSTYGYIARTYDDKDLILTNRMVTIYLDKDEGKLPKVTFRKGA